MRVVKVVLVAQQMFVLLQKHKLFVQTVEIAEVF